MRKAANPTIVVYPGYANHTGMVVFGHVFRQNLRHWYPYSDNFFKNLRVLWKLFRVQHFWTKHGALNLSAVFFRETPPSARSLARSARSADAPEIR